MGRMFPEDERGTWIGSGFIIAVTLLVIAITAR